MVTLTASAWLPGLTPAPEDGPAKWWQGAMLFGSLYIVALGTGGVPHLQCHPYIGCSDGSRRHGCLTLLEKASNCPEHSVLTGPAGTSQGNVALHELLYV